MNPLGPKRLLAHAWWAAIALMIASSNSVCRPIELAKCCLLLACAWAWSVGLSSSLVLMTITVGDHVALSHVTFEQVVDRPDDLGKPQLVLVVHLIRTSHGHRLQRHRRPIVVSKVQLLLPQARSSWRSGSLGLQSP